MLTWLLLGMVVTQVTVFAPSTMLMFQIGVGRYVGSRDEIPAPSVYRARAMRAAANTNENIPLFFALGILALVVGTADLPMAIMGAKIFVVMRATYVVSYILAIPFLRSVIWTIGWCGLALMFVALI
jgi:uncharacterized MAPEG superfamily protein